MGAEKNTGQAMLIAAGFLAAGIFALVSMAANLKFGNLGRAMGSLPAAHLVRKLFGRVST